MEYYSASLISLKVLIWQIVLGFIQYIGLKIGQKTGLMIAFIVVVIWTLSKTYNELFILQLIIQCVIAYFLYKSISDNSNNNNKI